jgi:hypothetical protein
VIRKCPTHPRARECSEGWDVKRNVGNPFAETSNLVGDILEDIQEFRTVVFAIYAIIYILIRCGWSVAR